MRTAAGDVLTGIGVAVVVPLFLRGPRLQRLLRTPPSPPAAGGLDGAGAGARADPFDADRAVWVACTALRWLGRVPLPGRPWRNTCLYRAVARCLVLRRRGCDAVLRLGVRGAGAGDPVFAHAWVELAGVPAEAGASPAYRTLEWPG